MPKQIKEWMQPFRDLFEDIDAWDVAQFVIGVLLGMGLVARQKLGIF